MFLDTLKELFEGNEPLFQGLTVHDLTTQLNYLENQFGITSQATHPSGRFSNLLRELHQTLGERVVVLVDEYDKPILE